MDPGAHRKFLLATTTVVIVIMAMAGTAVVALQATKQQLAQARQIDDRLARIDQIRAATRELGLSARRYILYGDQKEQQRVFAIVQEMRDTRAKLAARVTIRNGAILEADIEEFVAALLNAMSIEDVDPVGRLSKFEDELVRIRAPLSSTFDEVIAGERARRASLRSAHSIARIAQAGVLIAGGVAVLLVFGVVVPAFRRVHSPASSAAVVASSSPPTEPTVLR